MLACTCPSEPAVCVCVPWPLPACVGAFKGLNRLLEPSAATHTHTRGGAAAVEQRHVASAKHEATELAKLRVSDVILNLAKGPQTLRKLQGEVDFDPSLAADVQRLLGEWNAKVQSFTDTIDHISGDYRGRSELLRLAAAAQVLVPRLTFSFYCQRPQRNRACANVRLRPLSAGCGVGEAAGRPLRDRGGVAASRRTLLEKRGPASAPARGCC